jgi:Holliday junction DNA helicase RuvB
MTEELLTGSLQPQDQDGYLRPILLKEFIGQEHMKANLSVFMSAAQKRSEALDHTLLYGPPGLGKTTIAHIISREMGSNIKSTSGPAISKAADLAAILTNLQKNDVLFIDEIHRLSTNIEEVLYSAMEDYELDIIIGDGPAARSMRISLPHFTLVGATTRLGLLSNPLRDRFGIPLRLEFYRPEELKAVIKRGARILGTAIGDDGAEEIAQRARGTPRIALRLLRRVRDFAHDWGRSGIDRATADEALNRLDVDKVGLDSNDYRYLNFIAQNYGNTPVGVETIAAALSEQRDAIEEVIEPYLLQIGFVQRTPRGRILTPQAITHVAGSL